MSEAEYVAKNSKWSESGAEKAPLMANEDARDYAVLPKNGWILVHHGGDAEKTASGLQIPASAQQGLIEERNFWVVDAIGDPMVTMTGARVETRLQVGDRIMFGQTPAIQVKAGKNNKGRWLVEECHVIAVLVPIVAEGELQ